jgi:hypothetical protein
MADEKKNRLNQVFDSLTSKCAVGKEKNGLLEYWLPCEACEVTFDDSRTDVVTEPKGRSCPT